MRGMTRMSEGRSYSEGSLPHHNRTRSLRRDRPTITVSAVASKVFQVHAASSVYTRLASSLYTRFASSADKTRTAVAAALGPPSSVIKDTELDTNFVLNRVRG